MKPPQLSKHPVPFTSGGYRLAHSTGLEPADTESVDKRPNLLFTSTLWMESFQQPCEAN